MTFETPTFREAVLRSQDYEKHQKTLHPPCGNCGTPLSKEPGRNDLICMTCGERHHYLAPPSPADTANFQPGDNVAVEWLGNWWSAHVVEVIESGQKWRVHFEGWAPVFDAEVDLPRVRGLNMLPDISMEAPSDTKEEAVAAPIDKSRFNASPIAGLIMILITALGFAVLFTYPKSLTVPGTPMQPDLSGVITGPVSPHLVTADTPITTGQKLQIKWEHNWYMGTAVQVDASTGDVLVNFTRLGNNYNELVPRERLRLVK